MTKQTPSPGPLLVTIAGGNSKLGPCVASTSRLVGITCPPDCLLLNNGCYAQRGRVAMAQGNIRRKTASDPLNKASGVPLIRHLVAGDWLRPTADGSRRIVDRPFVRSVLDWHRAPSQRFTQGWGYSHAADRLQAAGFGPESWPANFQIMASCHSVKSAAEYQANGWHTARVITKPEDKAKNETLCPWDLAKYRGEKSPVTCSSCRLCLPGASRNVAFIEF
jgi:hypothetical protein